MRENCKHGSEGGEASAFSTPILTSLWRMPQPCCCERHVSVPVTNHLGIWAFGHFLRARQQRSVGIRLSGRFAQVKEEAMRAWPGDTEQNVQAA